MPGRSAAVLCVDLDGSLLRTDTLWECLVAVIRESPWLIVVIPFWLCRGRAALKRRLAEHASLTFQLLPYNQAVLDLIKEAREQGKQVVLATASDQLIADQVASQLGCFDQVFASDGVSNLKGRKKADLLIAHFGQQGFDYIGDSCSDLPVWQAANKSIVVGKASSRCKRKLQSLAGSVEFVGAEVSLFNGLGSIVKALRLQQWVKNLLLFVPVIMAHQWSNYSKVAALLLAFIAFGLTASSVYLVNDLIDLENDRIHIKKCSRPFAAGGLSLAFGIIIAPVFFVLALLLALALPDLFVLTLITYFLLSSCYTFWLKRLVLLDIIVLAVLYTLRVLAGGYAVDVKVSPWLLAFALFCFLSLACVKRFSELLRLSESKQGVASGRGYLATDINSVGTFGIAAGYISVLVVALYLQSAEVLKLYQRPNWLWLICPLLLYWISRVWLLAQRGQVNEDPIIFAVTDRASYVISGLSMLLILAAI